MESGIKLHPKFRLNGRAFSADDLIEVGYSMVKEGEAHEMEIGDFLLDWFSPHDFVEVYTSGSTGTPALHRIKKHAMVSSALATAARFNLREGQRALLCLPAKYIGGKMMLARALVLGLSLDYTVPSANPLENTLASYDFCAMVPAQFAASLADISRIRTLILGGAPLGKVDREAAQRISTKVYETFGMTETISHIAVRTVTPPERLFHALPGVSLAVDSRGCLLVNAPEMLEAPVQTNDLVRLESVASFEWLGRVDNAINSGGVKLLPEQIEQRLAPLIRERYFASGLPDKKLGERLVLFVEGEKDPGDLLKEIKKIKGLGTYEVPREIIYLKRFSLTGSGKTDRRATLAKAGYPHK